MAAGGKISVAYNDWFPIPGVTLSGLTTPTGSRGLHDSASDKSGALDINLPTNPLPYSTTTGGMVGSYFDDYYNRIHFTPGGFDFGAITNETSTQITVWSAYVEQSVVLNEIGIDTTAGLSVDTALPVTFAPLQGRQFTLEASVNGAAILDLPVVWEFDLPFTYEFPVTGARAKEWPLSPNWEQSYKVSYSFLTEILESRSGKEQRIALRTIPRKTVSFQSLALNDDFRKIKDLLWSWQDRAFVVPELPRFVTTTADLTGGSDSAAIDGSPSWLMPAVAVVLVYGLQRELRVVESSVAGVVTFKSMSTSTWPAGTKIHPALSGNLDPSTQVNRVTNAVARIGFRLSVLPLSEKWAEPPASAQTFNGREVWLKRPNWASEVSSTAKHEVDEIDFNRGPIYRYSPVAFGTETRRALYLNRNAAEADDLLNFFFRMRGRQGEFYMPSWEYDFAPDGSVGAGAGSMRVYGRELADTYGASTTHKVMFIQKLDGSVILRKVLSVATVDAGDRYDSVITIEGSWGFDFNSASIVMCGWVPAWRLASDELVVEWLTDSVAQVQMTMQTLEDLPL